MANKKKNYIVFWVIIAVIAVVFLSQFVFSNNAKTPKQEEFVYQDPALLEGMDSFAQCLTENGAIFYGTEWCPHCKAQKELFGASLDYINYIDCDEDRAACTAAGIQGYPTWQINGDAELVGTQQLSSLAGATGCELA